MTPEYPASLIEGSLRNSRPYAGLALLLACLLLNPSLAGAGVWQNNATAQISTEFDSNPSMASTNQGKGVTRSMLEPGYMLTGQFDETQLRAALSLQMVRTSNEALSPNRNSPTALLGWLRQFDKGQLDLGSKYSESSTRYLSGIDATAPVESTQTNRTLYIKGSGALSERSTLAANGTYENVKYQSGPFINYSTRSADFVFTYLLTETSAPFIKMGFINFIPAGNLPESRLDIATLGTNWKMTENLASTLQLGTYQLNHTAGGTQAAVILKYENARSQLNLKAGKEVLPSGLNGFVTNRQLIGGWIYALSERHKAGIDAVWQKSELAVNTVFKSGSIWLQSELDPSWNIRTYYRRNSLNRGVGDVATSYILGINLGYSRTDF